MNSLCKCTKDGVLSTYFLELSEGPQNLESGKLERVLEGRVNGRGNYHSPASITELIA